MTRSLRTRLLLGTVVGTSLVLLAAGVVLYSLIRAQLYSDFDATLASEAHGLAMLVEEKNGRVETEMAEHGVPKLQVDQFPIHYAIWNHDGRLLEQSSGPDSIRWTPFGGTPKHPEFRQTVLAGHRTIRMIGLRFVPHRDDEDEVDEPTAADEMERSREITLVVGRETSGLDGTLRHLGLLLAGVFGGAVLISIAVAAPIVRASLHPLKRISSQIKSLDTNALAERLDSSSAPDEVSAVIDCLNGLLGRLHDAFQRERAFSANVAHELRTPLAGLRSTIDVALAKPVDSADYRGSLERCLAICKQAESLTENLLFLARLDANQCRVEREIVSINGLLREIWASRAAQAKSRRLVVTWGLDASVTIRSDATLLSLILQNLIDNAVSYADRRGHIDINASVVNGILTIGIRNSAENLPADLVEHVFDRFWRADLSRSGTGEHAGLGLALCREAIRVLGGNLTIATQDGSFAVELRFHQADSGNGSVGK